MNIRLIGAILIVCGCGGIGFSMAWSHRKDEKELQQLLSALDYMQCELQYRLTPLPDMCRQTAAHANGCVRDLFTTLAVELEDQLSPDVMRCMQSAIAKTTQLSDRTATVVSNLGKTLGRFDLDGQLMGLENARQDCRRTLERLSVNRDNRLRSYQTLGLCAGAALAILFL